MKKEVSEIKDQIKGFRTINKNKVADGKVTSCRKRGTKKQRNMHVIVHSAKQHLKRASSAL